VGVRWRPANETGQEIAMTPFNRGNDAGKDFMVTEEACSDRRIALRIAIGARFRMSALGAARNPRPAEKQGTIIDSSRLNRSVRAMFDGRRSPMSLHRDYIEQISSEAE
jgi:hypothetical protein